MATPKKKVFSKLKQEPKLKGSPQLKYFDSMRAAAAVMGIPIQILQEAKSAGCPAFRASRLYRDEWDSWVKSSGFDVTASTTQTQAGADTASKEGWDIERLRRVVRKLDLEYEEAKGQLIPKQEVVDTCIAAFQPICSAMERYLDRATYNAMCREVQTALSKISK